MALPLNNDETYRQVVWDLFATCGLLRLVDDNDKHAATSTENSHRLCGCPALLEQLQQFQTLIQQQQEQEENDPMAMERTLCSIRTGLSEYRSDLLARRSKVMQIRDDNETLGASLSHNNNNNNKNWRTVVEHVTRSFLLQTARELQALVELEDVVLDQWLNNAYSTASLQASLSTIMTCLQGRCSELLTHRQIARLLTTTEATIAVEQPQHVPPHTVATTTFRPVFQRDPDPAILNAHSIRDAWQHFVNNNNHSASTNTVSVTAVSVVGPEGSGKSYLCRELQSSGQKHSVAVIRPNLPLDVLCPRLGESESVLWSIVQKVVTTTTTGSPLLLLLDNVHLITMDHNHSHQALRNRFTLCDVFDTIRAVAKNHVLIVCTSTDTRLLDEMGRFDKVFSLPLPTAKERQHLIRRLLRVDSVIMDDSGVAEGVDAALSEIVESTVGKSYAELEQLCRRAVQETAHWQTTMPMKSVLCLVEKLKEILLTITPESLKSGALVDDMDLRVWTARDLKAYRVKNMEHATIMSTDRAWKALQSSIIVSLCQSAQLAELLGRKHNSKTVVGGVLLAGESGSGKTTLALQCAAHAAKWNPAVKLLDISCTSLVHKEVGGSESAVHKLFLAARSASPCIVLLDGIETIAAVRGNDATTEGTMDRMLSTLLVEMDGVESYSDASVGIIGITRNAKWIDPALKRPGRLDSVVELSRPS